MHVTVVVMAGGLGERLWPLVRRDAPKVCLAPEGKRSLLRMTLDRMRFACPGAEWIIVTTREQAGPVRRCLPASFRGRVVVEPEGRNTAACVTLAAAVVAAREPRRMLVIVPADHWIEDVQGFRRSVRAAVEAAARYDAIATIGLRPTYAHPGLGYLSAGERLSRARTIPVFGLRRFIEKPSRGMARRLLKQRRTYWNSGMFVGRSDRVLKAVTRWLPNHARHLVPLGRARGASFSRRLRAAYRRLKAISFDHGVMVHLRGGVVVEGHFRWADLGTWDTWARLKRSSGRMISVNSENVTVVSQDRHLVAAIGVRDLVVVQTPTATLLCPPDRSQAVREILRRLAADRRLARYR